MAESPADLHAEIENYERKHAEHPEGRFFVPLANTYRKLGEFEKAEELLREGLGHHPDYLSAHIVLGRVYADRGSPAEAAAEFRHVLRLDPQNLVALRSLGELAAAAGDVEEAGRWYGELLNVDPMNEEARQALTELEEVDAAPPAETTPASEPHPYAEADVQDDAAPAAEPVVETEFFLDEPFAPPSTASFGENEDQQDTSTAPELADWEPPAPIHGGEPADAAGWVGWVPETQPAEEPLELRADPPEPRISDEIAPFDDTALDELPGDELATETIAELYAQQGFREEAAAIYRRLIEQRGEEPGLVRRLTELEAEPEEASQPFGFEATAEPFYLESTSEFSGEEEPTYEPIAWIPDGVEGVESVEPPAAAEPPRDEPTAEAAADAETGHADAFAESFSFGFTGAGLTEDTAGDEALASYDWGFGDRESAEAVTARADEEPAPTIAAHLKELLAWRPGAGPARPAEPQVEEERPAGFSAFADEPDSEQPAARETAEPEEPSADPGFQTVEEPTAEAGSTDELFPWELEPLGSDALEHSAEPSPAVDQALPEPAAERGQPGAASEAPRSTPSPQPAPLPLGSLADDEDDLESFQAWLRSLKR